jgi:hypothetical protein
VSHAESVGVDLLGKPGRLTKFPGFDFYLARLQPNGFTKSESLHGAFMKVRDIRVLFCSHGIGIPQSIHEMDFILLSSEIFIEHPKAYENECGSITNRWWRQAVWALWPNPLTGGIKMNYVFKLIDPWN